MPPITNDWADYLKEEYKKPYYRKLYQKVMDEYHTKLIFPPGTWIVIFCETWSGSAPIIG